jgi:integrase
MSYLADRAAEGQSTARAAQQLEAHVLPRWGHWPIAALTAVELKDWRNELATTAPRRRRPANSRPRRPERLDTEDAEQRRRRRSTVNRITTTFKAALNHAARIHPGECTSDAAWRMGLQAFRNVDAARDRWLSREEVVRLLRACRTDFRKLVRAALYTGCRYGELCRAAVGDFNPARKTLRVPISKTGRHREVFLNDEAAKFFADLVANQAANARLLMRTDAARGTAYPWGTSHQARRIALGCKRAGIHPPISFHGLRHTYASLSVESGMTLIAVARNLGHADTRMVERHYGHLSDQYLRDQVRRFAPKFETAARPGRHSRAAK